MADRSLKGNRTFSLPPQDVVNQGWEETKACLSKVLEEGIAARTLLWEQVAERQIKVAAAPCPDIHFAATIGLKLCICARPADSGAFSGVG